MYMNDLKAFQMKTPEGYIPKPRKNSKEDKFTNKIKAIIDETPNRKGKKFSRQDSNHLYVNNFNGPGALKGPK